MYRASGLGRACAEDICNHGGNVAILDLNEDNGKALEKQLGSSAKFFVVDVTDTVSIAAAVKGTVEWTKRSGKPLGGIIPAAGVGNPGLVCALQRQEFERKEIPSLLMPSSDP